MCSKNDFINSMLFKVKHFIRIRQAVYVIGLVHFSKTTSVLQWGQGAAFQFSKDYNVHMYVKNNLSAIKIKAKWYSDCKNVHNINNEQKNSGIRQFIRQMERVITYVLDWSSICIRLYTIIQTSFHTEKSK